MASTGLYTLEVTGLLNTAGIQSQLAALQSKINSGAVFGATGGKNGKGGKGGTTIYGQAGKEAKGATKQVNAFGSATKRAGFGMIDVTKKVMAFGAATSAIQLVTGGMASMVNNVVELDASLREYKKVSDLTGKSLEEFTNKAYEAGAATAKTGVEMIDAAT